MEYVSAKYLSKEDYLDVSSPIGASTSDYDEGEVINHIFQEFPGNLIMDIRISYYESGVGNDVTLYEMDADCQPNYDRELAFSNGSGLLVPHQVEYGGNTYICDIKLPDRTIEALFADLQNNVPFDNDERLAEDWCQFPKGTLREDIWNWFDDTHSKGSYYLLNKREPHYLPVSKIEIILDDIYRDESDQDISLLIFHIEKENETIASGMLPIAAVPGAKELLHSVTADDLLEYCRDNADKIDISSMPIITEASPITRLLVEDITRSENNMLYYFQNDPDEEDNLDFIMDYLPKGYDWAADLNRDIQKFHLENLVEFYTNPENAPITPDSEVSLVCYANLQAVFLHPAAGHERLKEELNQEVNIMNTVEETFYYQFAHKGLNGHCPEKLVNISNEKETWESLSDITCAAQYGAPKNYSVTNDENGLLHANINGKDTVIGTYFTVQDDDWYEIVGLAGQALDSDDLQHASIPGGQKNMQSLYNNVLKIAEGKLQPPKPGKEFIFTAYPEKKKTSPQNSR